jgi:hypothetical protein
MARASRNLRPSAVWVVARAKDHRRGRTAIRQVLCDTDLVIPTAIVAGFALGLWIRWWAVSVVAVGWFVVMILIDPSSAVAGGLLGALNGLVGVLPAIGVRRLLVSRRSGRAQSNHR